MKTISSLILSVAAGLFLLAGCSKDSNTSPVQSPGGNNNTSNAASDVISTSDVTEAVKNAVSGSTSGMATQSEQAAAMASNGRLACGSTTDSVITGTSPSWWLLTWNYNLNYSCTCICTGGTPSQYNTSISGTSGYSVLLMSSADTTNAQMSVSGVQSSAANYVVNESYTRTGTIQSLINSSHTFHSTLTITSTNLTIAKSGSQIVSGTAIAQFTGTTQSGAAASHTANITFLGNNQATLVTDNGTPSTISW